MRCWMIIFLLMTACDFTTSSDEKELNTPEIEVSLPQKNTTSSVMNPIVRQPYKTVICFAFLDTPNQQYLQQFFEESLREVFTPWKSTIECVVQGNTEHTLALMAAKNTKNIPREFFDNYRQYEFVFVVQVNTADNFMQIRKFDLKTNRFSRILRLDLHDPTESVELFSNRFQELLEPEAYFSYLRGDTGKIVFRGDSLFKRDRIAPENLLWIYRGRSRVLESFVEIQKTSWEISPITATVKILGKYTPQGNERLVGIDFTGGEQEIALLDFQQQPLEGYSIYTCYQSFRDSPEYYRGTTNISGKFMIRDPQKKLLYLTVAKNIDGVNFTFTEKHIIIENHAAPLKIHILPFEKATPNLSQEHLRKEIFFRLNQAKRYIAEGKLKNAHLAILYTRNYLPHVSQPELKKVVERIESLYRKSASNQKTKNQIEQAFVLIQKADEEVKYLNYEKAKTFLLEAKKIWPQGLEEEGLDDIVKRLRQLNILILNEYNKLGEARKFLSKEIAQFNANNLSNEILSEIEAQVLYLQKEGVMDKNQLYSDTQIILSLSDFLDKISDELATTANEYLKKYREETVLDKRRLWYQWHSKLYGYRVRIDAILQKMEF